MSQTHYTSPNAPHSPPPPEPAKKSWFARHKFLTGIGVIIALIMVISALSGGDDDGAPTGADPSAEERADSAADTGAETGAETGADAGEEPAAEPAEEPAAESAEEPAAEAPTEDPGGPGIGEVAADGKFEFIVTEVETGVEQVGSEFLNSTPQGQYVLVHLEVTNVGDQAQYLSDSDQYLFDTEGRKHSADTSAGIYIDDNKMFLNEINPGNTLGGILVFDIPGDAIPASVELHDSMFSGGVSVDLG